MSTTYHIINRFHILALLYDRLDVSKYSLYQQPLPSILHDIPSVIGLEASPASSGMSVTEPSSRTKHGIPAAPTFFASLKTGLLSHGSLEIPLNILHANLCL